MEIPFKYIILIIMKQFKDRKMPLVIDKDTVISYLKEFLKKSLFTINEKKEMCENFNIDFEWDDFINTYYQYFDVDGNEIKFDMDYIDELDNLINEEMEQYDLILIHDINYTLNSSTVFLDIIGIEKNKELYDFLLDIETKIEYCYNVISNLKINDYKNIINIDEIVYSIKKLKMLKVVMFVNTNSFLSEVQKKDLILYSCDEADIIDELDSIFLLLDDENFCEADILDDTFLRSIFVGSESNRFSLRDSLILNSYTTLKDKRYSKINFYLTFLDLLDDEINKSSEFLKNELIRIKYRIMNVLDNVYGMTTILGNMNIDMTEVKEDYFFIDDAVNYFIDELLCYDDEKYKNSDYDTDNTMIYLNNIMKKLLIQTYYNLTKNKDIINKINDNKLFGVNAISSGFLKDIVDTLKTKVKEINGK